MLYWYISQAYILYTLKIQVLIIIFNIFIKLF